VQDIRVESPVDGFVLKRNVSPGLRFDRGFEFYRIANLDRVWILADVYRDQLPLIRRFGAARITTADGSHVLPATVSPSEPTFDDVTLTLKVRLETANPRWALKPGMFVDVEFPVDLPPALVVPADAIVDSGLRKTVFVEKGDGYFEPRAVETGRRTGDEVEVTKGLMPGERIVVSGTFFIDSESRMKGAAPAASAAPQTAAAAARDPVCGMHVDPQEARKAGRTATHGKDVHFFCSDNCKHRFVADPSRYAKPPAAKP
jgi:Cu(I)/Ag(I) efflux system membrane fusion protein